VTNPTVFKTDTHAYQGTLFAMATALTGERLAERR